MSNARITKGEQLHYTRWEMATLPTDGMSHARQPERRSENRVPDEYTEVIEKARKEAFTKGMQDGYLVGLEKGRESAEAVERSVLSIAANFHQALAKADESIADEVFTLALDIAKAMVKHQIESHPETVLGIVKEAIKQLPLIQEPASLGLNPEDAVIVRSHMSEALAEHHWQIIEDNDIQRGGCVVVTATNHIDATNPTRWKLIAEALGKQNAWDVDIRQESTSDDNEEVQP